MYPILFETSSFLIYSQSVLMIIAFVAGVIVALHEGERFGYSAKALIDLILWGFLASFIGARFLFIVIDKQSISFPLDKNPLSQIFNGGFSFHGGLVAGGLVIVTIARYRQIAFWRLADALAPGLAVAMLFMRIGCLLNGCDYGVVSSVPWAVPLYGDFRHPIQLYEGLGNFALMFGLMRLNRKPLPPGCVCGIYLFLSSCLRVAVDIYRDDPARFLGMTIPQYIAIGIALIAGAGVLIRMRQQ
ncbi:prolipoprotein diacylglyceryl transferase [Candidatus Moduliflexus flocculans]|uniref:Phosphatidylglycerol--prolipoprotein diacylglyceryl transferase n=1 Tax=Candidatus Moduliflexus flocculans TaxID=1499966 RepID=A0A081BNM6_9BACT|nr:prolipoprotein diacylglyceryl transferase [Candidatus Moduliflexus flocculans]